jgi:recombination protein RecT
MSNQEQQQAIKVTQNTTVKQINIGKFLKTKENQIKAALPKHLTSERMLRIATTELRKIPKLRECAVESLFGAIIQCSQLGLEPGSALGQAYLIPYGKECQFMIGYRGMIDLARRSGQIVSISAQAVYENDDFDFAYGLNEKLEHTPAKGERGNFIAAYAIAKLKDGGHQMEVMFKSDIEKIRARSKAAKNGPWVTDYDEMAKKTVVRRLFKYLPISIEIAEAVEKDYQADDGDQNNSYIFDVEYETVGENESEGSQTQENKSDRIASKLTEKDNQTSNVDTTEAARKAAAEYFGENDSIT